MTLVVESPPPAIIHEEQPKCEMQAIGTERIIELLSDGRTRERITKKYRILTPLGYREVIECSGVPLNTDSGVRFVFIGPDWSVKEGKIDGTVALTWSKTSTESPAIGLKHKP